MANVFYSLVQRKNPSKKDAPALYYAASQKNGNMTFSELKKQIAHATMATEADVSHIVESLLNAIRLGLHEGKSVFLDNFGKFRLSFSSKGVATMKDFSTDLIKNLHIVFSPNKELKPEKKDLFFEETITRKEKDAALKAKKTGKNPSVPKDDGGNTNTGGTETGH